MTTVKLVSLAALILAAAACDRTESSTAPVTTMSPAGTSTAPSSASARHRDEALVRVVNAAPLGGNVDLFAGDLALFEGLSFKSVTPYRAIDGQRYAFALRPAGMTQAKPLSTNTEGLLDGHFYTAIAMPGDGRAPLLRVVDDPLDSPAAGKARLRIIHSGAGAGKVSVHAAGSSDMLFEDVDFRSVTSYRDVAPINGALQIVKVAQPAPPLVSMNTHLEAGRYYTIVLVGGTRSPGGLEAFLIEDALSQ